MIEGNHDRTPLSHAPASLSGRALGALDPVLVDLLIGIELALIGEHPVSGWRDTADR